MRSIVSPVPLLGFILVLLVAWSSAFSLPLAASAVMNGASSSPLAAAQAATKPDATAGLAAAAAGPATEAEGDGSSSPSHLVVLSHGLAGTADDLSYLKESLERSGGPGILVHSAQCNEGKTKDGVAKGGVRLAEEIRELVGSRPSLSRISLVGNSLGGLYMRYAAKLLYREHGGARAAAAVGGAGPTVAGLRPSVFMTIASPHLGVRRFTYVPLPSVLHPLAGVFMGKTGTDLFLLKPSTAAAPLGSLPSDGDDSSTGQGEPADAGGIDGGLGAQEGGGRAGGGREAPLLYNMATSEEFLRPLKAFRWRRAYANRHGDFMVPYGTAAFLEPDEEDGSEGLVDAAGGLTTPADATADTGRAVGSPSSTAAAPAVVVGSGSFTIVDRLFGAGSGALVGFSRVPPGGASTSEGRAESDEAPPETAAPARREAFPDGQAKDRKTMEQEMASGLNSCGWEKVSVDFGNLAPISHNKICALSRSRTTRALYGSGKSIVDHAADFLVAHDRKGVDAAT